MSSISSAGLSLGRSLVKVILLILPVVTLKLSHYHLAGELQWRLSFFSSAESWSHSLRRSFGHGRSEGSGQGLSIVVTKSLTAFLASVNAFSL